MKLEAMSISFQYNNGNGRMLNSVSISLESGKRMGLAAPSGFEKTVFCKILAGYEKPGHGTAVLDGENISSCAGYNPIRMVWQHPELSVNPRLEMREVLGEGDFVEKRVVRDLGIESNWLSRYPGELSGGELRRFYVTRALGKHTRFVLADEISTMLDLITQSQVWGFLLEEVKTQNLGLLAVSHSEELLERVCGRMVSLRTDQGRSSRMICMWKDWKRNSQTVWV